MEGFSSCTVQSIPVNNKEGTIEEILVRVWEAHNCSLNNLTWCLWIGSLEPVGASLSSVSEMQQNHFNCIESVTNFVKFDFVMLLCWGT